MTESNGSFGSGVQLTSGGVTVITGVLKGFADLLPGPWAAGGKIGVSILSQVLGTQVSSGPTWEDEKEAMRQIVREELIDEGLKTVDSRFLAVRRWVQDSYQYDKKGVSSEAFFLEVSGLANDVLYQLTYLLEKGHRVPGFPLLLLGVPMYLCLLQEKASLLQQKGVLDADSGIRVAGSYWAGEMTKIWGEVQTARRGQIHREWQYLNAYSHGSPLLYFSGAGFWRWKDDVTGEGRGRDELDWKTSWYTPKVNKNSKAACQSDMDRHYTEVIVPGMRRTFHDPEFTTANSWRNVSQPDLSIVGA